MATRKLDPGKVRPIYERAHRRLRDCLVGLPAEVLARPSVLDGWSVGDLSAHIALTADAVAALTPAVRGAKPLTIGEYVANYADAAAAIDELTRTAAGGPDRSVAALHDALDERLATAVSNLDELGPADRVVAARRGPIRLGAFLATRVIELVVHTDDLARSLPDVTIPAPERPAEQLACRVLLDVLAERAPGRSVELRVPPYAAIQCVPGPRHTRGTPPAVIETDATTWLRLAGGRVTWPAAVEGGQLSASGERADLSAYLPLL